MDQKGFWFTWLTYLCLLTNLAYIIWAKLGDEYLMESEMCSYDVEITKKKTSFDKKRKAFDF